MSENASEKALAPEKIAEARKEFDFFDVGLVLSYAPYLKTKDQ